MEKNRGKEFSGKTEKDIKRVESDLSTLLQAVEQSTNSIIVTDPQGNIEYVNRKFLEVTGYKKDEVLGKHTRMLKSGRQSPTFYRELWETIASGKTWNGEFNNRKKNGEFYWEKATISPVLDKEGKIVRFLGMKEDITARKKAEEALLLEKDQLRQIIDLVPHIIYVRNKENRYLLANKALCELYGTKRQQLLGKTDLELCPSKEAAKKSKEDDLRVIRKGHTVFDREFVMNIPGKGKKIFQRTKVPFRISGYDEDVVLGVLIDITRTKNYEEEIIKSREEALKASREKAAYLSVISHEIRSPLNAILGIAELLPAKDLNPDQAENLDILKFSAKNLLALVNDILDHSRMEAGKLELELVPLDLKKLLEKIIKSWEPRAKEKEIGLKLDVDPDIPGQTFGDSLRLSQIFNNLVGNGIKFTERGWVKLSAKLKAKGKDLCRIAFFVEDTGIGIDPKKIDSLFEPFIQADSEIARKYGGTGLGLTIIKNLVELHGGEVKVNSMPEEGSVFSFEVSFRFKSDSGSEKPKDVPQEKNLEGMIGLLVEDDVMSIILAKKLFARWKADLLIAETGKEALAKTKEIPFDIILLDLNMPDKDGFYILQQLKATEGLNSKTPVIAVTGLDKGEIRDKLRDTGVAGVLQKPYDASGLFEKISAHTGKPQQAKEVLKERGSGDTCFASAAKKSPEIIQSLGDLKNMLEEEDLDISDKEKEKITKKVISRLEKCGMLLEAQKLGDFLRLMTGYKGRNRHFLLKVIKKEMLTMNGHLIHLAEK